MTDAFYEADGDRFLPTEWTRGPWDPSSQHGGPPSALIGRAVERLDAPGLMRVARFTIEILRPVPIRPLTVRARVTRPGKRVQLCEAVMQDEAGDIARASAWRIAVADVPLPEVGAEALPHPRPHALEPWATFEEMPPSYLRAMDGRMVHGSFFGPGPAAAWMRMRVPLLPDEEPSPLQRVLAGADSGNGISQVLDMERYLFVNTELTVHLTRMPGGEWVCLDARTIIDPSGIGLAESVLWDEQGAIGRGAQALYVRER